MNATLEPTRYEIAIEQDGKQYLLAYSMQKGRPAILRSLRKHGEAIISACGITDDDLLTWPRPSGARSTTRQVARVLHRAHATTGDQRG